MDLGPAPSPPAILEQASVPPVVARPVADIIPPSGPVLALTTALSPNGRPRLGVGSAGGPVAAPRPPWATDNVSSPVAPAQSSQPLQGQSFQAQQPQAYPQQPHQGGVLGTAGNGNSNTSTMPSSAVRHDLVANAVRLLSDPGTLIWMPHFVVSIQFSHHKGGWLPACARAYSRPLAGGRA